MTSTTNSCGTCCDVLVESSVDLTSSNPLTEVSFRIENVFPGFRCGDDLHCYINFDDPSISLRTARGAQCVAGSDGSSRSSVEICVWDLESFTGPLEIAVCELLGGEVGEGPAVILHALDENFARVDSITNVHVSSDYSLY